MEQHFRNYKIFRKKLPSKRILLLEIEKKESKKTKKFSETTRVDYPESSEQAEQVEPGQ